MPVFFALSDTNVKKIIIGDIDWICVMMRVLTKQVVVAFSEKFQIKYYLYQILSVLWFALLLNLYQPPPLTQGVIGFT